MLDHLDHTKLQRMADQLSIVLLYIAGLESGHDGDKALPWAVKELTAIKRELEDAET